MLQIKFSETEVDELSRFYKNEHEKALKRLEAIEAILTKLGTSSIGKKSSEKNVKGVASSVEAAIEQIGVTTTNSRVSARGKYKTRRSSKRKRSGKWPSFIIKTLKGSEQPLKTTDLLPLAYEHFKVTGSDDQLKAERNLRGHLQRMNKRGEIEVTKAEGTRDNFYKVS